MTTSTDTPADTPATPAALAAAYVAAWSAGDPDAIRPIVAADVTFRGPFGSLSGVDEVIDGWRGLVGATTAIDVVTRVSDDHDVMTWFHLTVGDHDPIPVANWTHVVDGRIATIKVAFDPRPLLDEG